jgi:ribulose-5-phosphate 4-epimerase/fuculose-1-phosphate aldolase
MSQKLEIIRLRKELAEFSRRCFNRGLVTGTGGNLSVRVPGTDTALITPTGISLGDIDPEINLLMQIGDGAIIENPCGLGPSKETAFHLAVYQLRPEAGAVAHVHPPYATAYSNRVDYLPMVTVSAQGVLKEVPRIRSAMSGSTELYEQVKAGLMKHPAAKVLLMEEHGILAVAPDLKTSYYLSDLTEDTAKIAFIASQIKTT